MMYNNLIISINLMISILLTNMKSPLMSNLMIMSQSIMLTLMMNLINKTSWISFMMFILYIGGLMIIFLYISSIAANEFNLFKNKLMLSMKIFLIIIIILMMKKNFLMSENFNFENNFNFEDNKYFINLFIFPNNMMIYFIMMILFFMLIMIIWMLKNNKGPIRQKN